MPKKSDIVTAKVRNAGQHADRLHDRHNDLSQHLLTCMSPVYMQVTRINVRLVAVDILCIGNKPLSDERFSGIIRYGKGYYPVPFTRFYPLPQRGKGRSFSG